MKTLSAVLFGLVLISGVASADPWGRPGHGGPGWGPGWGGTCQVTFKKCDFHLNGFCVKWNNKDYMISRRDVRWACERAYREYDMVKDCRVAWCR